MSELFIDLNRIKIKSLKILRDRLASSWTFENWNYFSVVLRPAVFTIIRPGATFKSQDTDNSASTEPKIRKC